jgi:hypothetical protein
MAVDQLASATDVATVLGRDLTAEETARVEPILDKASELFRRESGQQFTAGTSDNRLRVRHGSDVFLPQRPVVSVESVTDDDGNDVAYTSRGQVVRLTSVSTLSYVLVEYTHGGDVPDLVRLAVAEIAAVVLRVDSEALAGKSQTQETTGPFSRQSSYASWAIGGATRLSPEDVALARSFRNPWRQIVSMGA